MPSTNSQPGMLWLLFVFMTIICWGLYGLFLHKGQILMGDQENGRYKAFLIVGLAYVIIAVLAPAILLIVKGASWSFTAGGVKWSFIAGTVGAIGAFGVLLAFGAKGSPAIVMSLIFAGAPIVNAVIAIYLHPPAGGFAAIPKAFFAGILLAALGGAMVMYFKPKPAEKPKPITAAVPIESAES